MASRSLSWTLPFTISISAAGGAAIALLFCWYSSSGGAEKEFKTPGSKAHTDSTITSLTSSEVNYEKAHKLVWNSIEGALNAAMMYVGDRLHLYGVLREMCGDDPNQYITEEALADRTGLHPRWLREWLAHHAAMGVLLWKEITDPEQSSNATTSGSTVMLYRLPSATAEVFSKPESKEYDISMIEMVPALVARAKTMLPEAFQSGIGRPYDEPDVSSAIDRHHAKHVRDVLIPEVLPLAGQWLIEKLQEGIQVADLGCGAGVVLIQMAQAFPQSTFHGYEISAVALQKAAQNVAKAKLRNVHLHDANEEPLGDTENRYDLVIVFDVLHDCTNPLDLIQQIKKSLKKISATSKSDNQEEGCLLLADISSAPTMSENLKAPNTSPATFFALSTCLCLSCGMSEPDGAGLGTLGFSVPVAQKFLRENGNFSKIKVLLEKQNTRWFLVQQ